MKLLSILAFHRVLPVQNPLFPGLMDAACFDHLLNVLKKYYLILPLTEAVHMLQKKRCPSKIISITFDDGYKDNCTVALPILLKHKLKATFFVASGFLNGQWMWNDGIMETVSKTNKKQLDLSHFGLGYFNLSSTVKKTNAINLLLERIKYHPNEDRIKIAEHLLNTSDVSPPQNLMMNPNDIKTLYASGMEIGGHTITHPILSKLSNHDAYKEIQGNKKDLENIINEPIHAFAYPNGKPETDFTKETIHIIKKSGYRNAVTTVPEITTIASNPFQLPRYTPWDKNPYKFAVRLWMKMMLATIHHD